MFVVLVSLGFLVWFAGSPGLTSRLCGVGLPRWASDGSPLYPFFVPVVCGALSIVSGFVFPRGFYLWGIALGLHGPFVEGLTVYLMEKEGYGLVGGTQGVLSYVAISAMLFVFTILCYTLLSTLGMALRYPVARATSR